MPSIPTILLILAAVSCGAAVIAALVALRSSREARSAIFPIVKEEETLRARRARLSVVIWLALAALFAGGWLATRQLIPATPSAPPTEAASLSGPTLTPLPPEPTAVAQEPAAVPDTPTLLPVPTDTAVPAVPTATALPAPASTPTPTPTSTSTPTLTPTPTHSPTATPTPSPVPPTNTPTPAPVAPENRTPAPPGVKLGPIAFGTEITDQFEVADPADRFPAGVQRIYASYPFSNMQNGLKFTSVWYRNGVEFARDETEWSYGQRGVSYSFMTPQGPGLYKLELYVNDTIAAVKLFEIR